MTLFGYEEHPLLEEIRAADLDGLESDEALRPRPRLATTPHHRPRPRQTLALANFETPG